jgi:DNA invertase Pin-like site-specific DNA recombinase
VQEQSNGARASRNGTSVHLAPSAGADGVEIAASYERVSRFHQSKYGYSLAAQHVDSADFAARNGLTLPDRLRFVDGVDEDASGADWELPDLNRMFDAARTQEFTVLIVPDTMRFARSMVKALVLEEQLAKYGVRVVYIAAPFEDTPEGRFAKRNMHNIGEYEREKIAFRTTRGRRQKALEGRYVGTGKAPFGYRYLREEVPAGTERWPRVIGLAVHEVEAGVVRELFVLARTMPLVELCAWAAQRELSITTKAMRRLLRNSTYIGRAVWGGIEIPTPAIVSKADFADADAALTRRQHRPSGRTRQEDGADPYLLRALLVCGPCSEREGRPVLLRAQAMSGAHRGHSRRYYRCPYRTLGSAALRGALEAGRCQLPSLAAEMVDQACWQRVCSVASDERRIVSDLDLARRDRADGEGAIADRRRALDATLAKQRRAFERLVLRVSELDPEADEDRAELDALSGARDQAKRAIAQLAAEEAALDRTAVTAGLSAEEAGALETMLRRIALACAEATAGERREALNALRLGGTIWPTGAGDRGELVEVGRQAVRESARQVRVEWTAVVRLNTSQGGDRSLKR